MDSNYFLTALLDKYGLLDWLRLVQKFTSVFIPIFHVKVFFAGWHFVLKQPCQPVENPISGSPDNSAYH